MGSLAVSVEGEVGTVELLDRVGRSELQFHEVRGGSVSRIGTVIFSGLLAVLLLLDFKGARPL